MTSAELSRSVFVSASTITGIIDRLEKHGFVERRRDEIDRRRVLLHPTGEGFKLAYRAPSPLQDQLMKRVRELPQEEQDRISESLQRVVDLMEVRSLDASPILTTGDIQAGASGRMKSSALAEPEPDERN
jgi:DNA-binding MarR family transcriptional regulator